MRARAIFVAAGIFRPADAGRPECVLDKTDKYFLSRKSIFSPGRAAISWEISPAMSEQGESGALDEPTNGQWLANRGRKQQPFPAAIALNRCSTRVGAESCA